MAKIATPNFSFNSLKTLLFFFGTAHVQATLFFYTDKDFRHLVRENKRRYVYLPLLLIVGTGLVFLLAAPAVQTYVLFFYCPWHPTHSPPQNPAPSPSLSFSVTHNPA